MWDTWVAEARRLWADWNGHWRSRVAQQPVTEAPASASAAPLDSLERLVLTDGVYHTLFEEYAEHCRSSRGREETGWLLMGHRLEREAVVLATLPAGARRQAGVAHVRFNSDAQAVASRILRQEDRHLEIVGVVHTHPGSMRHPSRGDFEGDRRWVALLRGREGVFGIGTADGDNNGCHPLVASQPKQHSHCYLGLRFSWYALGCGDSAYRPLPVRLTIGPDLARPMHALWDILEEHAPRLDRLARQLARVRFEVHNDHDPPALHLVIRTEPEESIRVILSESCVEYFWIRKGEWLQGNCQEATVDRGVYLMLASLAQAATEAAVTAN